MNFLVDLPSSSCWVLVLLLLPFKYEPNKIQCCGIYLVMRAENGFSSISTWCWWVWLDEFWIKLDDANRKVCIKFIVMQIRVFQYLLLFLFILISWSIYSLHSGQTSKHVMEKWHTFSGSRYHTPGMETTSFSPNNFGCIFANELHSKLISSMSMFVRMSRY